LLLNFLSGPDIVDAEVSQGAMARAPETLVLRLSTFDG
jgi:hypothetical protein